MTRLFCTGKLSEVDERTLQSLFDRSILPHSNVPEITRNIIERVRSDGNRALIELARELDGVDLESLEVPQLACARALEEIPRDLRAAMEQSAANIARVSAASLPQRWETSPEPGIIVGRRPDPFDAVGVYAPGGTASYPSSVLMGAVPARAAGVQTVVLATPPGKGGLPSQAVLAAAALAGVDRVFAIGGAGAIAALAFGTETIPRVAKIVGPGNAFVAEAKLQVSGITSIDSPAGPSEVLVIADSSADADVIAAELLAQAEHDTRASVIALLIAPYSLESVLDAIEHRLQKEPRRNIAARALAERGAVLQCDSIEQAIEFANRYAAEHLLLALQNPEAVLPAICNAGTVCLGASSSVVFGDYMTGANHVLPTGGMGRAFSGLSALDFVRWTSYQSVTPEAARRLAVPVSVFAEYEGLSAHAGAARIWSER